MIRRVLLISFWIAIMVRPVYSSDAVFFYQFSCGSNSGAVLKNISSIFQDGCPAAKMKLSLNILNTGG
ncbi:hypothetical protein [Maridesulfovibrio zosterae]|uniref:hypothetical protein n=1 Tax=Maridesulfovibrio zosterae TaxID=82171 RepID=UPI00040925CD|nr:hypothetical protein [Maridesulfovibrio zosterae]